MNEHSSYEISKRLHDKGFRAEHVYGWITSDGCEPIIVHVENYNITYPAYTFTELWAVLPEKIRIDGDHKGFMEMWKVDYNPVEDIQQFVMCYKTANTLAHINKHASPAECAAMMVEWLLDNGHIKSEVK